MDSVAQEDQIEKRRQQERAYIARCRQSMTPQCEGWTYLRARGFSDDEIERIGFGFDPTPSLGWADKDGKAHRTPRVVIPWPGCSWYHIDRAIDNGQAEDKKYAKPSGLKQPLIAGDVLDADVFFVVEGALDAWAIRACGFSAMATGGTSNAQHAADEIIESGYSGVVVALLDFDKPGREANKQLTDALLKAGVDVYAPKESPTFPFKDAGEALQSDRHMLKAYLDDAEWTAPDAQMLREEEEAKEQATERRKRLGLRDPLDVVGDVYNLTDAEDPIPTGIVGLDAVLDGGLHRGVTVFGAISSSGKTTLAAQIADTIAASGRPVLFVTIEQSAREIVAKSLTRIMRQRSGITCSTFELMDRKTRDAWNARTSAALIDAGQAYAAGAGAHLVVMEPEGQPTVAQIREAAEMMRGETRQAPVVFVDYLQLLAAQDEHDSDRRTVDRNMMSLRQMAKDMRTSVFIISSLNRSSYSGAITLDSFKESGGIEYGADVLLGLQPYGMGEKLDGLDEKKAKREADRIVRENKASTERAQEIVVLKNRSGAMPSHGVPLTFYPVVSMFRDGLPEWRKQGNSQDIEPL